MFRRSVEPKEGKKVVGTTDADTRHAREIARILRPCCHETTRQRAADPRQRFELVRTRVH